MLAGYGAPGGYGQPQQQPQYGAPRGPAPSQGMNGGPVGPTQPGPPVGMPPPQTGYGVPPSQQYGMPPQQVRVAMIFVHTHWAINPVQPSTAFLNPMHSLNTLSCGPNAFAEYPFVWQFQAGPRPTTPSVPGGQPMGQPPSQPGHQSAGTHPQQPQPSQARCVGPCLRR